MIKAELPYIQWISTQNEIMLERLLRWTAINSYSRNPNGIQELYHVMKNDFNCLGAQCSFVDLPIQTADNPPHYNKALKIEKRMHLKKTILLAGHVDTVYPPNILFPISVNASKDRINGPGVADMKGGIAILLTALEAFERSPFANTIGWEILLTPDEEIGSPGSYTLYQDAAKRHLAGLIFEPSLPNGAFVSERKGSVNFTLKISGIEAHVGRDFEKGRSAVFALAEMIQAIEQVQNKDLLQINVSAIESTLPLNIVPGGAACKINMRSFDNEALLEATAELEAIVKNISEKRGVEATLKQESFRPPKLFTPQTQSLFNIYSQCAENLNIEFQTQTTGGVCDGNILGNCGLPTLDTAGAIGGGLHTAEEYLIISSLTTRASLAALFLLKFAQEELGKRNE